MENQENIEEIKTELENQIDNINPPTKTNDNQKCSKNLFSKINFYTNIVLFIVLIIFIINPFDKKTNERASISPGESGMSVAFLNTDSVFENYNLVVKLKDELKGKKERMESEVMNKQQNFQTKLNNYQSNVQNNRITFEQAQNAEKKLMQERDEIVALGERYSSDIMAMEFQMQQQITDSVINFANRFNKNYNADYILGYTKGGGILVANEKYDITKDILKGLNEEYEKSLKSK